MKEIQNRALESTPRTNMTMSAVVRKHEGNSENDWCLASTHKLPKSLSLASCFSEKSRSAMGSQAWPELSSSDLPVIALSSAAVRAVLTPCVARAAVGAGAHPLRRQKPRKRRCSSIKCVSFFNLLLPWLFSTQAENTETYFDQ